MIMGLQHAAAAQTSVIEWGCPIPAFGNPYDSKVATVGINPSNREFLDRRGEELTGHDRRFQTLQSLGLDSWYDADASDLNSILDFCAKYFDHNPYDTWFKRLDHVISGIPASFYGPIPNACHLDLVPFATVSKWGDLSRRQQSDLLCITSDSLGMLLRNSSIDTLVLNGSAVVSQFRLLANLDFQSFAIPEADLMRSGGSSVRGYGYIGLINNLNGVDLARQVKVLGYNHNVQSSYGVTSQALKGIRQWLAVNAVHEL